MNNNEPIVLGKVKKGASGKPLVVIIVFLFIGSFLLFLPTITAYFGDYNVIELIKNGEFIDFFVNHDSYVNKDIKKSDVVEEKAVNYINTKLVLSNFDFTLTNFILKNSSITFDVKSNNKNDLDNSYYYLVLKKDSKQLDVIRIIGSQVIYEFANPLKSVVSVEGEIVKYKDIDYPEFTLSSDESGLSSLDCKKESDQYEYTFTNNLLTKIKETYNYKDEGDNNLYLESFSKYTSLSNKINNNGGISTIMENYDGFLFTTDIDLLMYKDIINNNYYSYNTKSNKVNFDMKAKGYDCK